MNHIDIILAIPLALGAMHGFAKGFIHEVAVLVGLVAGVYLAVRFSNFFSSLLLEHVNWNSYAVNIVSFAIVFLIVLLVIMAIGRMVEKVFKFTGLNLLNRLAGVVAGVFKIAFVLSIILIFFNYLNRNKELMSDELQHKSFLYNKVAAFVPSVMPEGGYFTIKSKIETIRHELKQELDEAITGDPAI